MKEEKMLAISFVVPCYNSQDYMKRCIDSLLCCQGEGEIIIIDDGSTDRTGEIADEYQALYPEMVRVIHQENGGHGAGVNAGLQIARGRFFKVVDSDDWLEEGAVDTLLTAIRYYGDKVDLFLCNYVYDHLLEGIQQVVKYDNVFHPSKLSCWNDMGRFHSSQYLVMHALVFRTKILRQSKVSLPKHTFYVDNLFSYVPLPYVQTIVYLDVNLYHYFLGREDQSVNEENYKKRIDQQLKVTRMVAKSVDLNQVRRHTPKLATYMLRNVSIMATISSIYLLMIGDGQALAKRQKLWHDMKGYDKSMYTRLRFTTLSGLTCLPGKVGRKLVLAGYRMAKKKYAFG